jgi:hypothetical protein
MLSEERKEELKQEHQNQKMELSYIQDPKERDCARNEALKMIQNAVKLLDYRCGDETLVISVPTADKDASYVWSRKSLLSLHHNVLGQSMDKAILRNCSKPMPYSNIDKKTLESILKKRLHELCLVCECSIRF